jgi:hypothetical protein
MQKSRRTLTRLTIELDDVTLIYRKLDLGHALFTLRSACDLDTVATALP